MLDFKTMDNATLAATLALYNRWRQGVGEFHNRPKKKLPYSPSECSQLISAAVARLDMPQVNNDYWKIKYLALVIEIAAQDADTYESSARAVLEAIKEGHSDE